MLGGFEDAFKARLRCESREAFAAVPDAPDEALGSGWTSESWIV